MYTKQEWYDLMWAKRQQVNLARKAARAEMESGDVTPERFAELAVWIEGYNASLDNLDADCARLKQEIGVGA